MIGYIYKITNSVNNKIYVGSTSKSLIERFCKHKANSKEIIKNGKIYILMREIGIDKFKIELLEQIEFLEKKELLKREQYYIDSLEAELNIKNTYFNEKEYNKKYNEKYNKKIYVCECGAITLLTHKNRHKQTQKHIYYINNKN